MRTTVLLALIGATYAKTAVLTPAQIAAAAAQKECEIVGNAIPTSAKCTYKIAGQDSYDDAVAIQTVNVKACDAI